MKIKRNVDEGTVTITIPRGPESYDPVAGVLTSEHTVPLEEFLDALSESEAPKAAPRLRVVKTDEAPTPRKARAAKAPPAEPVEPVTPAEPTADTNPA